MTSISSFRCKRSNNFLNKESGKKNIYKIPIKLIINGLSKAPLCIWTTVVSAGKGNTAITSAISHFWKIKQKSFFFNYIFTERSWNEFPLKVEKAFRWCLFFFSFFGYGIYIFHQVKFSVDFKFRLWLGHLSVLCNSSGFEYRRGKIGVSMVRHWGRDRMAWRKH